MTVPAVELALGTVQFGMKYGIAGRGEPVPTREVREIFSKAWEYGIRVIDTAPAYGAIEESLDSLTENYPFKMVSKIPAIPQELSSEKIVHFVTASIEKTKARLGVRLNTILFHRSADLLESHGSVAWEAAVDALSSSMIKLGVSCYSPDELNILQNKFPISAAQIPGNALDQRVTSLCNINNIELYLRSVFLQGILLLAPEVVSVQLPQAANKIKVWRRWCNEHQLTPLQAALSIAKGLPGIRYCVVGVDKPSHLDEILSAWASTVPLNVPALATDNINVIDPRRWL